MKTPIASLLLLSLVVVMVVGCSERIGDFTVISTKNVDIGQKYTQLGRFSGVDTGTDILLIPVSFPNLKDAVDNCIEEGNGDLLTNAVLEAGFWTAIVYGQRSFTVIGDVWRKAQVSDLLNPDIELYELTVGSDGFELVSVSDSSKKVKVDHLASR